MIKNYFAIHQGAIIDYTMAKKGIEYTCVECGKALRLRGGDMVTDHLYHVEDVNCNGETAIHLAYKEVFNEEKIIKLPINPFGLDVLEFDRVELEVNVEDIRPDAIGWMGEYPYFIEFTNTNPVSARKLDKIKKINIPCIEIYTGRTNTLSEIKNALINSVYNKDIIHYPDIFKTELELQKLKAEYENLKKDRARINKELSEAIGKIKALNGSLEELSESIEEWKSINNAKIRLSEKTSKDGNAYKYGRIDRINFMVFDNNLYVNIQPL